MLTLAMPSGKVQVVLTFVIVSCRSADFDEQDTSPPLSTIRTGEERTELRPAWVREDWWRPCRSDADCERNHVCIDVDRRPKQAMLTASLVEPKACALVVNWEALDREPPPEPRYMNRLLLIQKVRFVLSGTACTLSALRRQDGTMVPCHNTCRGELVWMSGFLGDLIIHPDGTELECKDRGECDPPDCPAWLRLDHDFEVPGAFHTVQEHEATPSLREGVLTFVLGTAPERWGEYN